MVNKVVFADYSDKIQEHFADMNDIKVFNKICVQTYENNLVGKTQEQGNNVIRTKMFEIMGIDPANVTERQIRKAFKKQANREAYFEIVEETLDKAVITGWGNDPWFKKYVEFKTMALGQKNEFYIKAKNVILNISEISGGHHQLERQRLSQGSTRSVKTRTYGAKVYMEAVRFLMGVEDWNEMIDAIARAFTIRVNKLVHAQVMSAVETLPVPAKYNRKGLATPANKKNFKQMIADVKRATGASGVIIMGTDVGLGELTGFGDVNWISAEAKTDVYNMGRIGKFEGNDIVEIPNPFEYEDETAYLESDTKVIIMPNTIGAFVKFFYEGADVIVEKGQTAENGDDTKDYEVQSIMGIETITSDRFGVWTFEA